LIDNDGNNEDEGDGNEGDDEGGDTGGDGILIFGTEGSKFVVHTYSSLLLMSSNNISLSTVLS
jgi:hypothetical protein